MNGIELREHCREAADVAVAKMKHRTKPDEFHEWFPKGECPLCSPVRNALEKADFYERLKEAVGGLL